MAIQYIYPDTYNAPYSAGFKTLGRTNSGFSSDVFRTGHPGNFALGDNDGVEYVNEGANVLSTDYINFYDSGLVSYTATFSVSYSGTLDLIPRNIKHRFVVEGSGSYSFSLPTSPYIPISLYNTVDDATIKRFLHTSGSIYKDGVLQSTISPDLEYPSDQPIFYIPLNSGNPNLIEIEYYNFPASGIKSLYPANVLYYNSGLFYNQLFKYDQQCYITTKDGTRDFKFYNSEIIISGEQIPQNKSINFLLHNNNIEPTGLPFVIGGSDAETAYIDLYMKGNLQSAINMTIAGIDRSNDTGNLIDFFLDAHTPTQVFNSTNFLLKNNTGGTGDINFYVHGTGINVDGSDDLNNSINFITRAIADQTSGNIDFSITGGTATHIPLFIDCHPHNINDDVDFLMRGSTNDSNIGMYTMYMNGDAAPSGYINFFLPNNLGENSNSYINLSVFGNVDNLSHTVDFAMYNNSGESNNLPFYIDGTKSINPINGTLNLYIERDYETTNGFVPFHIGNSNNVDNIDMFLSGVNLSNNMLTFNINGIHSPSGQLDFYINGY